MAAVELAGLGFKEGIEKRIGSPHYLYLKGKAKDGVARIGKIVFTSKQDMTATAKVDLFSE